MKGRIVHFRRNRRITTSHVQMIVIPEGATNREGATKLIGKTVQYNTGAKVIKGEVRGPHGNIGALRVKFEQGMPGQALGKEVHIG